MKALPCFVHAWRGPEEEMQREDLLAGLEALETQIGFAVCCVSAKGTQGLEF